MNQLDLGFAKLLKAACTRYRVNPIGTTRVHVGAVLPKTHLFEYIGDRLARADHGCHGSLREDQRADRKECFASSCFRGCMLTLPNDRPGLLVPRSMRILPVLGGARDEGRGVACQQEAVFDEGIGCLGDFVQVLFPG